MKQIIVVILSLSILSCSQKVSEKDLEGVWRNYENSSDYQIKFIKDSIIINNSLGFSSYGKFKLKEDSISIIINNEIYEEYLKYNTKDSSLLLNNYTYFKLSYNVNEVYEKIDFINIKSKKLVHSDSIDHYSSISFKLFKNEENELKVILNDKITTIEDIPLFLNSTTCSGGKPVHYRPYLILGQNLTTKDLSKIFPYLDAMNHNVITLVTQYDFQNRLFHFYDIRIELFKEQLLKNGPPPRESDITRTDYINEFKPEIVVIKSKDHFAKLDTLKTDLNYLISIDLDLSIEDYLHLNQKINSTRKKQKINIRTELIHL
ncbi:hypothetical protein BTO06_05805 [Tenacibaculum sp. SZ-18]|uniref:hypothetical protein n=1 Tax=Tenacibaculum sp. SZ-18 TaxID=754423 RepID=UPI000C2CE4CD|nr:hypothetical protein [Tenacibaculum sp. SZ-18]AUC14684.1 hypothetical protein BTO06_05805 [Tenacibaculum sp. SZ-18]